MNVANLDRKMEYLGVEGLRRVVEVLRSPQGCAWDRAQTSASLRGGFLEECYEALEAMDNGDRVLLREELGDVLLHLVFQSCIAQEQGAFTFDDVASDVAAKMVLRHPHVFAGLSVSGTEEILENWDAIKMQTKGQSTVREVLESVSPAMPALMRHQKVLKKAEKQGVLLPEDPALALGELVKQKTHSEAEIGAMLSAVVQLAGRSGIEAEAALRENTKEFIGTVCV